MCFSLKKIWKRNLFFPFPYFKPAGLINKAYSIDFDHFNHRNFFFFLEEMDYGLVKGYRSCSLSVSPMSAFVGPWLDPRKYLQLCRKHFEINHCCKLYTWVNLTSFSYVMSKKLCIEYTSPSQYILRNLRCCCWHWQHAREKIM